MKVNNIFISIGLLLTGVLVTTCIAVKKEHEKALVYTYGSNPETTVIRLDFEKGKTHNHPLFAVWLADTTGKFIQTLYVSESIGKGVFKRVDRSMGRWQAGEIQRPASLPYWAHQRNVKNESGTYLPTPLHPEADAVTGATPTASFAMRLATNQKLDGKYRVYLELNQSWDWNEYWTNDKFPDDKEYRTSSQPALVYMATIDSNAKGVAVEMQLIGRSHHSGANGELYTDLNTITTALKIAAKIKISVE